VYTRKDIEIIERESCEVKLEKTLIDQLGCLIRYREKWKSQQSERKNDTYIEDVLKLIKMSGLIEMSNTICDDEDYYDIIFNNMIDLLNHTINYIVQILRNDKSIDILKLFKFMKINENQ